MSISLKFKLQTDAEDIKEVKDIVSVVRESIDVHKLHLRAPYKYFEMQFLKSDLLAQSAHVMASQKYSNSDITNVMTNVSQESGKKAAKIGVFVNYRPDLLGSAVEADQDLLTLASYWVSTMSRHKAKKVRQLIGTRIQDKLTDKTTETIELDKIGLYADFIPPTDDEYHSTTSIEVDGKTFLNSRFMPGSFLDVVFQDDNIDDIYLPKEIFDSKYQNFGEYLGDISSFQDKLSKLQAGVEVGLEGAAGAGLAKAGAVVGAAAAAGSAAASGEMSKAVVPFVVSQAVAVPEVAAQGGLAAAAGPLGIAAGVALGASAIHRQFRKSIPVILRKRITITSEPQEIENTDVKLEEYLTNVTNTLVNLYRLYHLDKPAIKDKFTKEEFTKLLGGIEITDDKPLEGSQDFDKLKEQFETNYYKFFDTKYVPTKQIDTLKKLVETIKVKTQLSGGIPFDQNFTADPLENQDEFDAFVTEMFRLFDAEFDSENPKYVLSSSIQPSYKQPPIFVQDLDFFIYSKFDPSDPKWKESTQYGSTLFGSLVDVIKNVPATVYSLFRIPGFISSWVRNGFKVPEAVQREQGEGAIEKINKFMKDGKSDAFKYLILRAEKLAIRPVPKDGNTLKEELDFIEPVYGGALPPGNDGTQLAIQYLYQNQIVRGVSYRIFGSLSYIVSSIANIFNKDNEWGANPVWISLYHLLSSRNFTCPEYFEYIIGQNLSDKKSRESSTLGQRAANVVKGRFVVPALSLGGTFTAAGAATMLGMGFTAPVSAPILGGLAFGGLGVAAASSFVPERWYMSDSLYKSAGRGNETMAGLLTSLITHVKQNSKGLNTNFDNAQFAVYTSHKMTIITKKLQNPESYKVDKNKLVNFEMIPSCLNNAIIAFPTTYNKALGDLLNKYDTNRAKFLEDREWVPKPKSA